MKCHHLLAVAVVFVAGSFGIIEAYSPFGGYNRAPFDNVWVRADSRARAGSTGEDEATEQRMVSQSYSVKHKDKTSNNYM